MDFLTNGYDAFHKVRDIGFFAGTVEEREKRINDELFGSHPAGGDGAAEKRRKYYEELMQYRLDKHGDTPNGVPEDALEAEMQIMDEEP